MLRLRDHPGLTNVLSAEAALEDVLVHPHRPHQPHALFECGRAVPAEKMLGVVVNGVEDCMLRRLQESYYSVGRRRTGSFRGANGLID
jgi:hypothetical protein